MRMVVDIFMPREIHTYMYTLLQGEQLMRVADYIGILKVKY